MFWKENDFKYISGFTQEFKGWDCKKKEQKFDLTFLKCGEFMYYFHFDKGSKND